jgi:alpha-glucosidase (family GH31 glycosyl hydrolase)
VDAWTGEELVGPVVTTHPAQIDRIPVFVAAAKAGTLTALFEGDGAAQQPVRESMEVGRWR